MNYQRPDPGHIKGRLRGPLVFLITGAPSGGPGEHDRGLRGHPWGGLTGRHDPSLVGSVRPPLKGEMFGGGAVTRQGPVAELCPHQTRPPKPKLSLPQNVTPLGDGAFKGVTQWNEAGRVGRARPSRLGRAPCRGEVALSPARPAPPPST